MMMLARFLRSPIRIGCPPRRAELSFESSLTLSMASALRTLSRPMPDSKTFAYLRELEDLPREQVRSGGFVLDTLGAALWCALHTESYKDCVLAAVNLGDDSDTTACVAGAIAGAIYGYEDIPSEWISTLSGAELIEGCFFL